MGRAYKLRGRTIGETKGRVKKNQGNKKQIAVNKKSNRQGGGEKEETRKNAEKGERATPKVGQEKRQIPNCMIEMGITEKVAIRVVLKRKENAEGELRKGGIQ